MLPVNQESLIRGIQGATGLYASQPTDYQRFDDEVTPEDQAVAPKPKSFKDAFALNKAQGKDSFTWKGKKYHTYTADDIATMSNDKLMEAKKKFGWTDDYIGKQLGRVIKTQRDGAGTDKNPGDASKNPGDASETSWVDQLSNDWDEFTSGVSDFFTKSSLKEQAKKTTEAPDFPIWGRPSATKETPAETEAPSTPQFQLLGGPKNMREAFARPEATEDNGGVKPKQDSMSSSVKPLPYPDSVRTPSPINPIIAENIPAALGDMIQSLMENGLPGSRARMTKENPYPEPTKMEGLQADMSDLLNSLGPSSIFGSPAESAELARRYQLALPPTAGRQSPYNLRRNLPEALDSTEVINMFRLLPIMERISDDYKK